jgi:primary-amine oxidase
MMFGKIIAIFALLTIGLGPLMMVESAPSHPLDSLVAKEYKAVTQILQDAGRLTNSTRFAQVSLVPPAKDVVKSWTKGEPIPRTVVAYLKDGVDTFKTVIDLVAKSVLSFDNSEGEPMFL